MKSVNIAKSFCGIRGRGAGPASFSLDQPRPLQALVVLPKDLSYSSQVRSGALPLDAERIVEQGLEVGHAPAGGGIPSDGGYYSSQQAIQRREHVQD